MPKTKPTKPQPINSRVEITDPALIEQFNRSAKRAGHKVKTHIEWIVARWLEAQNQSQPQG